MHRGLEARYSSMVIRAYSLTAHPLPDGAPGQSPDAVFPGAAPAGSWTGPARGELDCG